MPRYQIRDGKRELVEATKPTGRPAARDDRGRRINAAWQCGPGSPGHVREPGAVEEAAKADGNPPARPGGRKKGH